MSRTNRDLTPFVSLASAVLLSCAGSVSLPAPTAAQTPLDRLLAYQEHNHPLLLELKASRATRNPFTLAKSLEAQLEHIWTLANQHHSPKSSPGWRPARPARLPAAMP